MPAEALQSIRWRIREPWRNSRHRSVQSFVERLIAGTRRGGAAADHRQASGSRRLPSAVVRSTPESARAHSLPPSRSHRCRPIRRTDLHARSCLVSGMAGGDGPARRLGDRHPFPVVEPRPRRRLARSGRDGSRCRLRRIYGPGEPLADPHPYPATDPLGRSGRDAGRCCLHRQSCPRLRSRRRAAGELGKLGTPGAPLARNAPPGARRGMWSEAVGRPRP